MNNESFKRHLCWYYSNIVWQAIILLVTAIGTPIVSVITLIKKSEGKNIDIWWWCIFCIFILLSICNIVAAVLHFVRRKNKPSFPTIKSDVSYNLLRTELHFIDRENIKCNRQVSFVVLCEKMRYIRKQFTWTGDGYKGTVLDEESKSKNYKIDDSVRKLPPQIYDIEFDCEKKRGEEVSYKITSEVEDKKHVMQPILSQEIVEETKYLNLILTVPVKMVKNVNLSLYADTACKNKIGSSKKINAKLYGGLETYEVEVKTPKLLHIYRLEWEWK